MIRLLITFLLVLTWQLPAYGYIDPGSGSAIMSAIIGFFVAAGMLVKTYWYKLKSFLQLTRVREIRSATLTVAKTRTLLSNPHHSYRGEPTPIPSTKVVSTTCPIRGTAFKALNTSTNP